MNENQSEYNIKLNRTSIDSLDVYDVTADELEQLESGSPSDIILNFAIAALSIGISTLISLVTLDATSDRVFLALSATSGVGIFAALVLFVVYFVIRRPRTKITQRIRGRGTSPEENSTRPDAN